MVSGGVEWQVVEANGGWHRQMVVAGGKQWAFELKAMVGSRHKWLQKRVVVARCKW